MGNIFTLIYENLPSSKSALVAGGARPPFGDESFGQERARTLPNKLLEEDDKLTEKELEVYKKLKPYMYDDDL
jgi:hypothetical protein